MIFKQKSRENWLMEGDKNSKFFHASTLIRRCRNHIGVIKEKDNWLAGKKDIGPYFLKEFSKLYESNIPVLPSDLSNLITLCISEEDNKGLIQIPSCDEIKEIVWSMHPLKSPGPDGFPGIFYRNY